MLLFHHFFLPETFSFHCGDLFIDLGCHVLSRRLVKTTVLYTAGHPPTSHCTLIWHLLCTPADGSRAIKASIHRPRGTTPSNPTNPGAAVGGSKAWVGRKMARAPSEPQESRHNIHLVHSGCLGWICLRQLRSHREDMSLSYTPSLQ